MERPLPRHGPTRSGAEGPTSNPAVLALRLKQQKNFLATLLLAQGVPMICAGDELGRTQRGNNNGFCQKNEISWLDWRLDEDGHELLAFVRELIRLRRSQPVLLRRQFLFGHPIRGSQVKDITWYTPAGREMTDADWQDPLGRSLGLMLAGDAIGDLDDHGHPIAGDTLLVLINAWHEAVPFVLPDPPGPETTRWRVLVDTAARLGAGQGRVLPARGTCELEGRSLLLLRREAERL